jgi:hypothetical protein
MRFSRHCGYSPRAPKHPATYIPEDHYFNYAIIIIIIMFPIGIKKTLHTCNQ